MSEKENIYNPNTWAEVMFYLSQKKFSVTNKTEMSGEEIGPYDSTNREK